MSSPAAWGPDLLSPPGQDSHHNTPPYDHRSPLDDDLFAFSVTPSSTASSLASLTSNPFTSCDSPSTASTTSAFPTFSGLASGPASGLASGHPTPASGPPTPASPSFSERRRLSSARPLPLKLASSLSKRSESEHLSRQQHHHQNQNPPRFLPRTSSLTSLPNITTITTTVGGSRRSQSLASPLPSPYGHAYSPSLSQPSLRRRPLATDEHQDRFSLYRDSSSPSIQEEEEGDFQSIAEEEREEEGKVERKEERKEERNEERNEEIEEREQEAQEAQKQQQEQEQQEQKEQESSSQYDLDSIYSLDRDSVDQFDDLPRPEQRFTRSYSVDSPTLYEFPSSGLKDGQPSTSAAQADSLSVSKPSGSSIALSTVAQPDAGEPPSPRAALTSRNSPGSIPAAPQTAPTAASPHHEHDPETDLTHTPERTNVTAETDKTDETFIIPEATMSLFSRKQSPPHLSLGSLSNTSNTSNTSNKNIHDAQPSPALSASNLSEQDFYAAYQDDQSATDSPTVRPLHDKPSSSSTPNNNNNLKPLPKSPASSKFGTFFGWTTSPSSSEFSDRSPLPSPYSLQPPSTLTHASTLSSGSLFSSTPSAETTKNEPTQQTQQTRDTPQNEPAYDYDSPTTSLTTPLALALHLPPPTATAQIEEMEDELKAISAELASSIRREMDLEDLVDRLQAEVNNPQAPGKRTSDYYSDSGYSSSKAASDYGAAKEEISQVQRRAEQEKAQVRLELTQKLSDERTRRVALDRQIQELSERAASFDQLQAQQRSSEDVNGRVKTLESTCEDLRRRLNEERNIKETFEDLLAAMKSELQSTTNERDNLLQEVVPSLRARVEGLESQAHDLARQSYETSKMQQELQTLKQENSTLRTAADESELAESFKLQAPPLSRSNTVKQPTQPPSSTPTTATATSNESREQLAERLRDVEAQRDALHSALRNLLERQEFQNRENSKKVRVLELERERLLSMSPKKAGYERDVNTLREEVGMLRRRAEEALEQKWQVEKGLGSLKMDLDRAEEEIAMLRRLLKESDILAPPSSRVVSGASGGDDSRDGQPATSASLEKAFRSLQASYGEALERIRLLQVPTTDSGAPSDEKTALAIQRLEQALSSVQAERDAAQQDAAAAQSQLDAARAAEASLAASEASLAQQLDASTARVEELAAQVRAQLAANAALRDRLTAMVARGETEQRINKERITGLEARLRSLEEQLVATQTAAEERVARHEEQLAALREAHNTQLQRLRDASGQLRAPSPSSPGREMLSPRLPARPFTAGSGAAPRSPLLSPLSPMFNINGRLVPSRPGSRPGSRGSGSGSDAKSALAAAAASMEADQKTEIATLRRRVGDLEAALASADEELQEVVGRMNAAQIEVLELQEEREQAGRETRQLQKRLEAEQVKNFEERFKTLGS